MGDINMQSSTSQMPDCDIQSNSNSIAKSQG